MRERNRVYVAVARSAASATVGADGDRVSFPYVDDGHRPVPQPAPSAVDEPDDERRNMSKIDLIDVGVDDDVC